MKPLKSDAVIHAQVIDELRWDTRIDETEVGVEVDQGIVTLTGTVESYAKKLAAQEAAHSVSGVLDVANDIQIKIPGSLGRTDTEIAQAVRHAIEWDAMRLPAERIQTTVSNGWVTLSGEVEQMGQRTGVERAIEYLAGVKGVTNTVTVKPKPVLREELKKLIEQALARRAARDVASLRVEVGADGVVTLAGRVPTRSEAQTVLGSVRFAPGVRQIVDRMQIGNGL